MANAEHLELVRSGVEAINRFLPSFMKEVAA